MSTDLKDNCIERLQKDEKSGDKSISQKPSMQRWRILKQALLGGQCSSATSQSTASVRRFKTFDLLQTQLLSGSKEVVYEGDWYEYTSSQFPGFKMDIRHLPGIVKPETLFGFNNTGNVCVWPAEEILTYHCLNNLEHFREKTICELGGGMTCLAGVAIGVSTGAKEILLTDGNEESVTNLTSIIERNKSSFQESKITSRVLRWGSGPLNPDLIEHFDVILCADCLFFEDGRQDLVDVIYTLLKPEGEAILYAPARGDTFERFVKLAADRFETSVQNKYDQHVWDLHCKLKAKGNEHYDPNIHYPLYLHLKKIPASRETSMER